MATVQPAKSTVRLLHISDDEHPNWIKSFASDMRFEQLAEDNQAWTSVTSILMAIVSAGLILAVVSVLVCMAG